jgi:hypothetical protein
MWNIIHLYGYTLFKVIFYYTHVTVLLYSTIQRDHSIITQEKRCCMFQCEVWACSVVRLVVWTCSVVRLVVWTCSVVRLAERAASTGLFCDGNEVKGLIYYIRVLLRWRVCGWIYYTLLRWISYWIYLGGQGTFSASAVCFPFSFVSPMHSRLTIRPVRPVVVER